MKVETAAEKLNRLLGITPEQVEALASDTNPAKAETVRRKRLEEFKNQPATFGYTDDEFADIRIMQGTLYFLQAPELFTIKQCPSCNDWFAVSRAAVGYCSYECMDRKFKELGLTFHKGANLVELAQDPDVWRKNEPLWTIKLMKLQHCLQVITEAMSSSLTQDSPEEDLTSTTSTPQSITLHTL